MKRLLYAALLLGLAACHSQTSPPAATQPAGSLAAPLAASVLADSPGASYRVYRGVLPGQADSSTLHLVTAPQPRYDTHGPSSQGSYYGPDGHPYELGSQPSAPDSLVLNDYSPEHGSGPTGQGPIWRLKKQSDGSLAGTIDGQAVRLRLVASDGKLTFAVRCLADSLAAGPRLPAGSSKARIYLQTLALIGGGAASRQRLQASISRELSGDTLDVGQPMTLAALFGQQRDTLYQEYRESVADLVLPTDTAELNYLHTTGFSFDDQTSTNVLYQQGDLLSLGFSTYTYTGGAHGANGATAASYDLRTGRRLRYADIFKPEATAQLSKLLNQAVRKLLRIQPSKPLDALDDGGPLSVPAMPVTHNVFLTAGGVEFIYEPYEIASYALGVIRVFLPLAQVRPLLRPGLPLPGSSSVAVR